MKPSFIYRIFDNCSVMNGIDVCVYSPMNKEKLIGYFESKEEAWMFFDKWCEKHLKDIWVDDESCLSSSLCEGLC